jgi:hypothetical protein
MAIARTAQNDFADQKFAILERQEIDSGNDDVSAQKSGIYLAATHHLRDGANMLRLDQRYLTIGAGLPRKMVPD